MLLGQVVFQVTCGSLSLRKGRTEHFPFPLGQVTALSWNPEGTGAAWEGGRTRAFHSAWWKD